MERERDETFIISETNSVNVCRSYHNVKLSNQIIIKEDFMQWKSIRNLFSDIFLPHGFPESVSKDYLKYQIWDSIQAFASSIMTSISTHAVLKGVGVGNENATPLAATITWLIKDGTSMMGRITFAWLQGTKLDSDCKKWRLFADILNDAAIFLDLLTSHFEGHFMLIICLSGLCKALVGVAGGATRAALTQHQARKNNMADVSAKDGSQETLVNLLALICSITVLPLVSQNLLITWMLFCIMTSIHLVSNYLAVKSVCMETFNKERFRVYAKHYISSNLRDYLSVLEVNKRESVFLYLWKPKFTVSLGVSFKEISEHKSWEDIQTLLKLYEKCDYILSLILHRGYYKVDIILDKKATTFSQVEALYQACFIEYKLSQKARTMTVEYLERTSRNFTIQTFPVFKEYTESRGFKLNTVMFDTDLWRAEW